jgi:molybdopterin molybdotransferase
MGRKLVRLKGFDKLTDVDEAFSIFLSSFKLKRLGSVKVPLKVALERVTIEDVVADYDLPRFDRSAVDGYAVRAQDTFGASQSSSKILKIIQNGRIGKNDTVQVWTGNMLPRGADAVVMLEYAELLQDKIEVWTPVTPGENVSKKGEDVKKGEVAIEAGTRLKPHHIGLLAALGVTHVKVVKKPKVAILSTGNELVEVGHKPKLNQVVDVNRLILSSMCSEIGVESLDLGVAKDNVKEIKAKIRMGIERADAVITSGGTSVGYADLVPKAVNQIGTPGVVVHGIAMRPGMPTALAVLYEKPIFILSGNSVAAMIGFEVFARPILLKFLGVENETRPIVRAKLTRRVPSVLGRQVFLRVCVFEREGEFFAEPVRIKGSGVLTTMTEANGYVIIPKDREGLDEDENVPVYLFDKLRREERV